VKTIESIIVLEKSVVVDIFQTSVCKNNNFIFGVTKLDSKIQSGNKQLKDIGDLVPGKQESIINELIARVLSKTGY